MVIEPDNAPQQQRRKRQHEGIVGEATLSKLLPKGYTLLGIILLGAFYATMSYRDIGANADDVKEVKKVHADDVKEFKKVQTDVMPRVQQLETNQAVIRQTLGSIQREQKRAYDAGIRDRREIIEAIKDLKK
jgi:hypothetical protein